MSPKEKKLDGTHLKGEQQGWNRQQDAEAEGCDGQTEIRTDRDNPSLGEARQSAQLALTWVMSDRPVTLMWSGLPGP